MMLKTHTAFSLFLSLLITKNFELANPFLFTAIAMAASVMPDIDHANSFIGKKLEFLSIPIRFFFRHRGAFHNMFFVIVVCFPAYLYSKEAAAAILAGYGSHLLLDSLTRNGIQPLYPLKIKLKGFFRTNSFLEHLLFLIITAAVIYQLL